MCLFKKKTKITKEEFEASLNPSQKVSDFYIQTERKTFDYVKEKAKNFSKAYKYIDTMVRDYITQSASSGNNSVAISYNELKEELKKFDDAACLFNQVFEKLFHDFQDEGFYIDLRKKDGFEIVWNMQGAEFGEEVEYL